MVWNWISFLFNLCHKRKCCIGIASLASSLKYSTELGCRKNGSYDLYIRGVKLTILLGLEVSVAPASTSPDLAGFEVVCLFPLLFFHVNNSEIGKNKKM